MTQSSRGADSPETPTIEIEQQVMFFDTDCAAVVHNLAYLRMIETARTQWDDTQRTIDRVMVALVQALDLMRERRKMPVFTLREVKSEE